jgi:dihydroxyacetone kinase
MKKLINQPTSYVEEMLAGLLLANPGLTLDGGSQRVIRRASGTRSGKVGIASGGGSGHLPLFTGYVVEEIARLDGEQREGTVADLPR